MSKFPSYFNYQEVKEEKLKEEKKVKEPKGLEESPKVHWFFDWSPWTNNILVTKAFKGSSIAVLSLVDTPTPLHVFYQDPDLHVRDLFNRGGSEWYHGGRILAPYQSMNESSLHCRFHGLWCTTTWNAYNS